VQRKVVFDMVSYYLTFNIVSKVGNPEKSGYYFAVDRSGHTWTLPYSKRHDKWNTSDYETEEAAQKTYINVVAWAEIGHVMSGVLDEVKK
jgi:hypothetical protein